MRDIKVTRPTQIKVDANFPVSGKAQNISVKGDNTGTPWIEDIINDRSFGWQERILSIAGIVPNGLEENASQSQITDAIKTLIKIESSGYNAVGSFRWGVTFTSDDDVGVYLGKAYKYVGGDSYPVTVPANTVNPEVASDYEEVSLASHNSFKDRNVAGAHKASSIGFDSGESVEDLKKVVVTSPSEAQSIPTALKSNSGGSIKLAYNENSKLTQTLTFTGEFTKGFTVDGGRNRFTTSVGTSGLLVDNKVGDIASEYFNKAKFVDFEFIGNGATASPVSYGFIQRAAAGINTYNLRTISFNIGMLLDGALTSNHYSPVVRSNGIGISAKPFIGTGGLNSFSPNANNFFGAQIQRNNQAVNYDNNPSGAVNWFGVTVEANNLGGNDTDGVQVFKLTNAGHHNIIGAHFESNLGQYGIWFEGTSVNKNLLVAGSEVIHDTDTVLHVEKGILTAISSRITNNGATNDINLQTGTAATLIDSEARVSGDLSKTVGIKFGRIKFGGNPVDIDPLISATPSAINSVGGEVSRFSADYISHVWRNAAGSRLGVMSFSNGGNWAFTKDGATGYAFNSNGAVKFYIGRGGSNSIEPGSDNTISFGSAVFRATQVFAVSDAINTSDEREKQDIEELTPELIAVGKRLMKLNKKYRWVDSVEEKGDGARTHIGLIAQEVIAAFEAEGLDAFEYGAVCYDEWDDVYETIPAKLDDEGNIITDEQQTLIVEAGNRYGLRFQQLNELRFAYINSVIDELSV